MRNLKKLFAVVVVVAVMLTTMIPAAFAEGTTALSADAKACSDIGMLTGDGTGVTAAYTATQPARIQALVMILRLKGVLAAAQATPVTAANFSDVTKDWQKPLTAYAKAHPELGFVGSNGKFDPDSAIDAKQYYSVMLTALGYSGDYTWATVLSKAASVGLTKNLDVSKFTVNDLAVATVETLKATVKGSDKTLVATLADADSAFAAKAIAAGFVTTPATLAVKSLTQLNSRQIQVVFNKTVDKTSAETIGNYEQNGTDMIAANASASLQSDNKTVVITFTAAQKLVNDTAYAFKVSGVKDLSADFSVSILAKDTTAPALVSATSSAKTTTNLITLTFSEPIDFSSASVTVNGSFAALSAGGDSTKVTVTNGTTLTAGTTYNLSLMNFKDAVNNYQATNPLASTVVVSADTTAPSLVSATLTSDSKIVLTFDKSMNVSTITTANVKLLDANLANTGITLGTLTAEANKDNKVFDLALTAIPFNSSNSFAGTLVVTNAVTDAAGNAITAITKPISITKDSTAPQVVSSAYQKVTTYNTITTANGAFTIKYNKPVAVQGAIAYTVVDNNGATVASVGYPVINPNDDTEIVFVLSAGVASGITNYTVIIPGGLVKDKSLSTNGSAAQNIVFDVSSGAPTASDTAAPTVNSVTATAATTSATGSRIVVVYGDTAAGAALDLTTVLNTNNYRLDGAPLPANSYITYNSATMTATIIMPAGSITATKTAPAGFVFNISGIKDKAGNLVTTYVGNITLADDIAPELKTATLNSNGTLSLGFSENLAASGATSVNDFTITLNGTALNKNTAVYSFVDGTGSDSGKYVMTVNKRVYTQAATSGALTITGVGTFTGSGSNLIKVNYIDANNSGALDAGDIVISSIDTLSTSGSTGDAANGTFDLNNATTLKVETIASPSVVRDTSAVVNYIKGSASVTVK